jgi:SHS2 domain-containing protein
MKARRTPPVAYEMVDHTADLGVELSAKSLSDLFAAAGAILGELMYDPDPVVERESREVALEAASPEELLVRWLNELIYLREVDDFLWKTVEVEAGEGTRLAATLRGEVFRPGKHVPRGGLKAATYHQLRISREGDAWSARIIFDV